MNRTDRLYAIAEQLRAAGPRGRTAGWLAARFEVSIRTVKRDVTALQEAGVPVWGAGGPGGGYVLDGRAALPPLTFTAGEAVAMATALAVAQPGLPFGPDGRSALAKVLAALPDERRDEVGALADRVWINAAADPARGAAGRTVDEGLRTGRWWCSTTSTVRACPPSAGRSSRWPTPSSGSSGTCWPGAAGAAAAAGSGSTASSGRCSPPRRSRPGPCPRCSASRPPTPDP
jgi:hypothetical protein